MVASTTAADAFSTFRFFFGQLLVDQFQQFGQGVVLRQPVCGSGIRCCNRGCSVRQNGKQVEIDAGDEAVFEFGIGEAVHCPSRMA